MAVRIYTLAKELKLDSKELVELCSRAGIHDKGSALASLSDEEVAKLREFMSAKSKPPERPSVAQAAVKPPAAEKALRREDYIAPTGVTGRASKPAVRPSATPPVRHSSKPPVERSSTATPKVDVGTPSALPQPPVPTAVRPEAPLPKSPPPASAAPPVPTRPPRQPLPPPIRRVGELRAQNTGEDKPRPTVKPKSVSRPAPRPAFKLAPMPAAKKPVARTSQEPAPQKPDVKLPLDAIRSAKAGGAKPLAEHMRKHEQRQADAGRPRPGGVRGGEASPPPLMEAGGRLRRSPQGKGRSDGGDLLGGREVRQLARKRTTGRRGRFGEEDDRGMRRRRPQRQRRTVSTAAPRKTNASLQVPCTVRAFSEAIGLAASEVLKRLLNFGMETMPSIGMSLDRDMVELLAAEIGVELDIKTPEDLEQDLIAGFEAVEEDPALQQPRPPVVTFLGHVDHGKTSLLDRILGIDVAAGESGGITQHIRAYTVTRDENNHAIKSVTFVDTPGHEAFTQMRVRGANVTDCAVIVVAADDGLMPQTEEAISHARAANVPIVVCINKIDLPGADVDKIYQQLAANELLPSEWGGETEVVKTSALTGEGVEDLLETLLTIAELHDLRANPDRDAAGVCLDASVHEGRGVVACLMVQKGTLKVGDAVVCGEASGHVKSMTDTLNRRQRLTEAGPSRPVFVAGLDTAPAPGERFYVVESIAKAREVAVKRTDLRRESHLSKQPVHVTLENLFDRLDTDKTPILNLIIRADVRGSIEAILKELEKLEHPEVGVRVLQSMVGGITEADVALADASDAVIIGFNVAPDERARSAAEDRGVQIKRYSIIYQVTDDLRNALEGMLAPERREAELGRALVQRTFSISRFGVIAGCRVIGGMIYRNARMRVVRDSVVVGDYAIDSLRREKDDVREVRDGLECGIKLAGFNDIKEADILECYRIEEVARTLS
ncbi:MAG: translation initiation factor IF-2 [Pirellulales bacterium]|nr:translation initiation factor IF-2 [Pirellulales bacterium]